MKNEFKSDIVKNYLKKYPNTPSLTVAKKIFGENSEHWKDVEDVRSMVTYYRGLKGKHNRKAAKKELFVPKGTFKNNPFVLPKSYARSKSTFTLPIKCNNILFISDLHVPFHDIQSINRAIEFGHEKKINCIFINGDLLDFYQISRFVKLVNKRSVKQELVAANQVLDVLNKEFPNVPIYFLLGNHDKRLEIFLAVKAPELLDMEVWKLEELLFAKKHNMTVIDDTTLVKAGKLAITHGHLLTRGFIAPVNASRGVFLKAKESTIISHVHKVSSHQETTIKGKTIMCWSTGCLCELNPEYAPFANNYANGFAWIRVLQGGGFRVNNYLILNGELMS